MTVASPGFSIVHSAIGEALSIIGGFTDFTNFRLDILWSLGFTRFQMAAAIASILALLLTEVMRESESTPAMELWSMRTVR